MSDVIRKISFKNIITESEEIKNLAFDWRNKYFVRCNMLKQAEITEAEHKIWLENIKTDELEFYISEQRYLGYGWEKKILDDFLKLVFDDEGIERIISKVLVTNTGAYSIYMKNDFQMIDEYTDNVDGKELKVCVLKFMKTEWEGE
ncbi:hypothetical protein KAJ27_04960, partial [bacterium]|nr:hypothetical protein [bacterium]